MVVKQAIADLLFRVMEENVVVVPKRGVIWRLGWGQAKAGAWSDLLKIWEDCGGERGALHGVEHGGKVVLFYGKPNKKIVPVADWAEDWEEEEDEAA